MRPRSNDKSRHIALREQLQEAARRSPASLDQEASKYVTRAFQRLGTELLFQSGVGTACDVLMQAASLRACTSNPWPPDVAERLRKVCSYLYWNARFNSAAGEPRTDSPDFVVDTPSTAIEVSHWACFLDYSFGDATRARWLAGDLLGYHAGGSIRIPSAEHDGEFLALFEVLARAIADERWPSLSEALGPYKALIEARTNQVAFEAALGDVLDLRMARACGYPQVDAERAIRGMQRESYLMEAIGFALIPAELWAIQALTRRIDGHEVKNQGAHPWLSSLTFGPPPSLLPV